MNVILVVHVKPNAKQTKVVSQLDDHTFSIAIQSPPTGGRTNEALVQFLSEQLGLPKTFINLKRGHSSRVKHIELPEGTVLGRLTPPAAPSDAQGQLFET